MSGQGMSRWGMSGRRMSRLGMSGRGLNRWEMGRRGTNCGRDELLMGGRREVTEQVGVLCLGLGRGLGRSGSLDMAGLVIKRRSKIGAFRECVVTPENAVETASVLVVVVVSGVVAIVRRVHRQIMQVEGVSRCDGSETQVSRVFISLCLLRSRTNGEV